MIAVILVVLEPHTLNTVRLKVFVTPTVTSKQSDSGIMIGEVEHAGSGMT
jgi:arabinogalactan endo-1,4-beta-galactosidase